MIYWKIFVAMFIPAVIGYGGGPASIPLIEDQVIDHYGWMTSGEFAEMLAIGNALPGPIATKLAAIIGYQQGGILGVVVAEVATIAPSLILMIVMLGLLYKFKDSPRVKRMTLLIRPAIAILLGIIAYDFFSQSLTGAGWPQTLFLTAASILLLEKLKIHPALVIAGALAYGAVFLS